MEAFNGVVSTRHNRMNNFGGQKGNKAGDKLDKFEVLGKWMGRCCTWQHGDLPPLIDISTHM